MSESENYYEELGVEPGASREEIREAHRQRVADLEAERGKKGVTESQLQANRDEVARVRAAWNVLSDPFQRQRYDAQLDAPTGEEVELVDDDDAGPQPGTEQQLTGWRKLLAPPPPKQGAGGAKSGNGKGAAQTANRRNRPEPTIVLPGEMQLAEPRQRGMAMLFDIAILLVIYTGVSFLLPAVVQSDYSDIVKQIDKVSVLHDKQVDLNDADTAKEEEAAQEEVDDAEAEVRDEGINPPATARASDNKETELRESIVGTQYAISITILVLGLLYLVPSTARTGRNRRIKVGRVDGSPVTWWSAFVRFFIPLAIAFMLLIPLSTLAPLLGLAIVGWSFFDRNRQGIHDKLARTVVVAA
jgi:uncharacterized RDD family membrane protein YckC